MQESTETWDQNEQKQKYISAQQGKAKRPALDTRRRPMADADAKMSKIYVPKHLKS